MITWYLLLAFLIIVAACEYSTFRTGVPTLSTLPSGRRAILDVLIKNTGASSPLARPVIIDLGSGLGKLAQSMARALPHAQVIGMEISYFPYVYSVLRQKLFGPHNLVFQRRDFWTYDCGQVDVIVIYLTENIIERLSLKLRRELKPGAVVIANDTALRGDWEPVDALDTGFLKMKVYLYRQR